MLASLFIVAPAYAADLTPQCQNTVEDGVAFIQSAAMHIGGKAEIRTITGAEARAFLDAEGARVHQQIHGDTVLVGTVSGSPAAMVMVFEKNCYIGRNMVDRQIINKELGLEI